MQGRHRGQSGAAATAPPEVRAKGSCSCSRCPGSSRWTARGPRCCCSCLGDRGPRSASNAAVPPPLLSVSTGKSSAVTNKRCTRVGAPTNNRAESRLNAHALQALGGGAGSTSGRGAPFFADTTAPLSNERGAISRKVGRMFYKFHQPIPPFNLLPKTAQLPAKPFADHQEACINLGAAGAVGAITQRHVLPSCFQSTLPPNQPFNLKI